MSGEPRFGPGTVLSIAEADYCYGRGTLTLRIEKIGADPRSFSKLEWVRVVGVEIGWDADRERREVMVRVSALPRAMRPPDFRPDRYHGDRS